MKGKKRFGCLYPKEDLIMPKSNEKGASRKDGNGTSLGKEGKMGPRAQAKPR